MVMKRQGDSPVRIKKNRNRSPFGRRSYRDRDNNRFVGRIAQVLQYMLYILLLV